MVDTQLQQAMNDKPDWKFRIREFVRRHGFVVSVIFLAASWFLLVLEALGFAWLAIFAAFVVADYWHRLRYAYLYRQGVANYRKMAVGEMKHICLHPSAATPSVDEMLDLLNALDAAVLAARVSEEQAQTVRIEIMRALSRIVHAEPA
jgi:hypothetical protein